MQCPKCNSNMNTDKHLHALGCEVELVRGGAFRDERIETRYCENCGYIELYRIAKNK